MDIEVNELQSDMNIVEIVVDGKASPRLLHESTKGMFFVYKGKRVYAYEYTKDGELEFQF